MVKSLISIIISFLILVCAACYEQIYLKNTFDEMQDKLAVVEEKLDNKTAVKEDILVLQEYWIHKKESLHIFVPHNDIKEIELWISEAVIYTEMKDYDEARSKIAVVIDLTNQIPKYYMIRWKNIL